MQILPGMCMCRRSADVHFLLCAFSELRRLLLQKNEATAKDILRPPTLSKYLMYSSAIAVEDSAKMSLKDLESKLHSRPPILETAAGSSDVTNFHPTE